MRVRHVTTIDQLIHASLDTISAEYRSIADAADHEFHSETERARYTALVRAYGLFTYGERFTAALGSASPASTMPVKPVCSRCGSDSLARDASARWDEDVQNWTISGVYDVTFCDTCLAESDDLCSWVPTIPTTASAGAICVPDR